MATRNPGLRVGILLAASLAMVVGIVLALTSNRLENGQPYESYFRESVQGLEVGAPVKFRGVTLGRITNIGLVAAEYGATADEQVMDPEYRLIVVRYKIDPRKTGRMPDTSTAVKSGLRARIASQGLTGVMYLELDFVDATNFPVMPVPWQPQDAYIPSVPSTIAQVQDTLTTVARKIAALDLDSLFGHLDGLAANLQAATGPDSDAVHTLAELRATATRLHAQADAADLPGLVAELKAAAAGLKDIAAGKETKASLASARAALDRLPALIAALERTARDADRSLGDVSGELLPAISAARASLDNLRDASDTLRRDPGAALWQKAPPREGDRK